MRLKYQITVIFTIISIISQAQNYILSPYLSTYYANTSKVADNCSFAGTLNQMLYISKDVFATKNLAFGRIDLQNYNSTFDLYIEKFSYPHNAYSLSTFSGDYAYQLQISKQIYLAFGLKIKYILSGFNNNQLVYSSMLDEWGETTGMQTNGNTENNQLLHFGASVSMLMPATTISIYSQNYYTVFLNNKNLPQPYSIGLLLNRKQKISYSTTGDFFLQAEYNNMLSIRGLQRIIKNKYSIGINEELYFHNNKIFTGMGFNIGFNIKKIYFEYSNLLNINAYKVYGFPRQQIGIFFKIKCRKKNRYNAIICPAYQF